MTTKKELQKSHTSKSVWEATAAFEGGFEIVDKSILD